MPSRPSESTITCVSSLSSAPRKIDSLSASAAQINARFVMLFEPGGRMLPRASPAMGLIGKSGGSEASMSDTFSLATQQPGHDSLLHVHPIRGLLHDDTIGAVDHFVCHF